MGCESEDYSIGRNSDFRFCVYYQHYVSDMTRTIHIGHVTDQEREIYDIVLKSNQAIIDNVKSGMKRCDYDYLARQVIENLIR
ncbi:peptidase M24 family protein [Streptococcus agalactiae H36B]|nr:peptidase M24 family protein [Streptococcus agalactiae H36B]